MKKNLGRLSLGILLLASEMLFATTYEWKAFANKQEVYVDEAIYLHYNCEFSDSAELYVIEFDPVKETAKYRLEMLREETKIVDGKKINSYEFVLYVKEAGAFTLAPEALMKKTNKDSIENSVLGRDNANYEEFSNTSVSLKPLQFTIDATPVPLVGAFSLKAHKSKTSLEAFTPFHLTLEIQGHGDFQKFNTIDYKVDGVKVFSQKAKEALRLRKDGLSGVWSKKFAFVSEKSFTIPPLVVEYFDTDTKKVQKLQVDAIDVDVKKPSFQVEELVDTPQEEFKFSYAYVYYLLVFVAGYLFAKIEWRNPFLREKEEKGFCSKVKMCTSLESLNVLLTLEDAKEYEQIILQIENKELVSLQKAKKLICA